jgi:hypothetical protein
VVVEATLKRFYPSSLTMRFKYIENVKTPQTKGAMETPDIELLIGVSYNAMHPSLTNDQHTKHHQANS